MQKLNNYSGGDYDIQLPKLDDFSTYFLLSE